MNVELWGWCTDPAGWVKILVDDTGRLIIDPSAILEDTPTNGEVEKAPTSNWAYDHEADTSLHLSILTTLGDIIRRAAAAPERLGIGAAGQVLTVVAGQPAWAAGVAIRTIVSDILQHSNDTEKTTSSDVYVKVKEISLGADLSNCRVKYDAKEDVSLGYSRLYKNGAAIGTEEELGTDWLTASEDFADFAKDDLIQVYAKIYSTGTITRVKNFRLYYSLALAAHTNQDP